MTSSYTLTLYHYFSYAQGCTIKPQGAEDIIEIATQAKVVVFYAHGLTELLGELPIERIEAICGLGTEEAVALKTFVTFSHEGKK